MKQKRITFLVLSIVLAFAATAFAFAGCNGKTAVGGNGKKTDLNMAVSYYATESTVYSSTAEVVKNVADTVVEISTESVTTKFGRQYIVSGAGSGVIVGKSDGIYLVVTNNHVIDGANDITVRTRAGNEYEATLVATDDSADIAVVSVSSDEELKIAVWGDSDDLQIGEYVIAIGNPLGNLGGTVTQGILSATGRTIIVGNFAMTLLQTDAAINPGNSGGGLFNMRGQLIGIVNAKTSEEGIEGLCFAIPANAARDAYGELTEHGYLAGRATLNIELAEGTISMNAGLQSQTVAYISAVGESADGNFKLYDRLSKINGADISSILDYNCAMADVKPGETVNIEVYRGTLTQSLWGNSLSFDSTPTTFTVTAAQYGA